MNVKLEAALAYGRMRWRIFPCHSIVQTPGGPACSCGKTCSSPGKHPRTRGGFKDATDDESQIRKWWTKWPDANIALATGSGIAVFDIDGPEGAREFKQLVAQHEPVPETLAAATGRGYHLVYATRDGGPEVRSSARGNVHVRGEGGYIIVAPSDHISGRKYQWVKRVAVAPLPDWLRQWSQGYEISTVRVSDTSALSRLGALPKYLETQPAQQDVSARASEALRTVWSPSEQARLISALAAIPANQYETWFQVGMALKDLGWERADGTDLGFLIWDEWSQTCPEKYALAVCEAKWNSFKRSGVSIGTVYHLAQRHGWNGIPAIGGPTAGTPSATHGDLGAGPEKHLNGHANGVNGQHALPAAFGGQQPIFFPDRTEEGKIRPTMLNTKVAIGGMAVDCRFDLFHNRMLVAGEVISKWSSSELSDHVVSMLRDMIRYRFGFDPGKQNTQDAAEILCLNRMFDPVLDYLGSLRWDGTPRLDRWMVTYLGAPDTELNHAVSRLSLIAAVRRVRHPGTKFDQIIVLEGPQGQGKSEAIEILAGPENFSDQSILGVDDRKQQELTEGVWLYEIGELNGIRRTDIEHIKAFASRKVDRARPAYGRYMVQQPRRTVFFASCNRNDYLQDDTGNRRFWPVAVHGIDLAGLRRDRDQLWAEAAHREATGESHYLPEKLWRVAGEIQAERMEADEWADAIANYLALKDLKQVSIMQVLTDNQFLQLSPGQVGQKEQSRAARVLRGLGFERFRDAPGPDGRRPWRYRKP